MKPWANDQHTDTLSLSTIRHEQGGKGALEGETKGISSIPHDYTGRSKEEKTKRHIQCHHHLFFVRIELTVILSIWHPSQKCPTWSLWLLVNEPARRLRAERHELLRWRDGDETRATDSLALAPISVDLLLLHRPSSSGRLPTTSRSSWWPWSLSWVLILVTAVVTVPNGQPLLLPTPTPPLPNGPFLVVTSRTEAFDPLRVSILTADDFGHSMEARGPLGPLQLRWPLLENTQPNRSCKVGKQFYPPHPPWCGISAQRARPSGR